MMQQPIQQRNDASGIGKDLVPFLEGRFVVRISGLRSYRRLTTS
jgi:hypothetical protein